ncbi:hypothetical protein BJ684DRAFT_16684 [Piptocephalis cylindrospora]|uniref:Uncharacterized protein n=1 Tax=Piptocephalis cylindrospora TaxID=1907219 RepID=A0A4P9Y2Q1_9FUNG|nr:hypothetical protein BJ684DRAFT_16684 [Piptocephalis cylindrospora]|eukprot:RKP12872.1 hypothetical protein BJ684DRAFT_16684 [Piptocephalis cylindrospora]
MTVISHLFLLLLLLLPILNFTDLPPFYVNPAQPIRIVHVGGSETMTYSYPVQIEGHGPTLFSFPEKTSFGSYMDEGMAGPGRISYSSTTSLPPSMSWSGPADTTLNQSTSSLINEGEIMCWHGNPCGDVESFLSSSFLLDRSVAPEDPFARLNEVEADDVLSARPF